jgi:hypothetical protein
MYSHRTSTNKDRMYKIIRINNERYIYLFVENFVLPREEARRLFRAYNHVWDLKMDEDKLQRVLDACARNGNTAVDEALKLFAK